MRIPVVMVLSVRLVNITSRQPCNGNTYDTDKHTTLPHLLIDVGYILQRTGARVLEIYFSSV